MKSERFTAAFFMSVLIMFMCLALYGGFSKKLSNIQTTNQIDWENLYPFDGEKDHYVPPSKPSILGKIYQYVKIRADKYTTENLPERFRFVEIARIYEGLTVWNFASIFDYNAVVGLHDGYLSAYTTSKDVSESAEAAASLDEFCKSLGIDYMYVNIPSKICVSEDRDISGTLDYVNQNADRFLQMLKTSGVKYYDLRAELHKEGMNHHKAFYRTDHHWKPETGLWAAKYILQVLKDDYGWDTKPEMLAPENFEYVIYPDWFLGSSGKKLTLLRTTPEDFTLIYPKFTTQFRFEVPVTKIDTIGDFAVIYNMAHVSRKDYYNMNPYGAYKYGDQPLSKIHNMLNTGERKVLILHDSMSTCMIPFIALGIEKTDDIDLRQFTGSLRTYIKTTRPDLVITAYNSSMIGLTTKSARPNNKMYDFR